MKRRAFIQAAIGAIGCAAAAALPLSSVRKIEFNYQEKFSLWHIHNRIKEGQRVFVWRDDKRHNFTTTGNPPKLPATRGWVFIGMLDWRVNASRHFEYWVHS
jgi:hypothetical protein